VLVICLTLLKAVYTRSVTVSWAKTLIATYHIYWSITRKILYQNTNAKFGVHYKRGLRFLCLYTRGHMSSGAHNNKSYARECANTVYIV